MLKLPKSTQFGKRIGKKMFYENLDLSPAVRRAFTEQILTVRWANKLSPATMNIAPGNAVTELQIFEIILTGPVLDEAVLRQMDRQIPYHVLFLLEFEGRCQAWIGFKEALEAGRAAFRVDRYYHTEWMERDQLPLTLEGLTLDDVYENLVRQIAGDLLPAPPAAPSVSSVSSLPPAASDAAPGQTPPAETLKQSVERQTQCEKLRRKISTLEKKICREPQFNRQVEMNGELQALRRELAALT